MNVFDVCVKFYNCYFNNKRNIAVQKIKVRKLVLQTCKTFADPRNSAVFDIIRVIFEIHPDPRRKHFINRGWGDP